MNVVRSEHKWQQWPPPTVGLERGQKASHHAFGHTGVGDLGVNVDLDERGEVGEERVWKALLLFVETQHHLLQGAQLVQSTLIIYHSTDSRCLCHVQKRIQVSNTNVKTHLRIGWCLILDGLTVGEMAEEPTSASVRSFSQSGLLYFSCMKGIQLNWHFLMNGLTSTVPRA